MKPLNTARAKKTAANNEVVKSIKSVEHPEISCASPLSHKALHAVEIKLPELNKTSAQFCKPFNSMENYLPETRLDIPPSPCYQC